MDTEDSKELVGRENYIKVIIISEKEMDDVLHEEVVGMAGDFLENKDDCDWNAFFWSAFN